MMEYLLKVKTLVNNITTIGKLISKKDSVLQILRGPSADYNPIVASIAA